MIATRVVGEPPVAITSPHFNMESARSTGEGLAGQRIGGASCYMDQGQQFARVQKIVEAAGASSDGLPHFSNVSNLTDMAWMAIDSKIRGQAILLARQGNSPGATVLVLNANQSAGLLVDDGSSARTHCAAKVPQGLASLAGAGGVAEVGAHVVQWASDSNPFFYASPFANGSNSTKLGSTVVSVTLSVGNRELEVQNLSTPFVVTLPIIATVDNTTCEDLDAARLAPTQENR